MTFHVDALIRESLSRLTLAVTIQRFFVDGLTVFVGPVNPGPQLTSHTSIIVSEVLRLKRSNTSPSTVNWAWVYASNAIETHAMNNNAVNDGHFLKGFFVYVVR